MSLFYLDHQPIQSCGDDYMRTGAEDDWTPAQQAQRDGEYHDEYTRCYNAVRQQMIETLAGRFPVCPIFIGGRRQVLTGAEIAALLIEGKDAMAELGKLFASPLDADAKAESWVWASGLIEALVVETARHFAKTTIGEEA
ncbi:hypothetical protein [Candidimonas nitroreducens]|uniref:Uncharacterized protein n=1 Tax=Candidimonas nitroreducens TaxID=683354 RepID=A0A225MNQ3_9BURK|nr:hypothetical protein [Candidimonas nitroreducens]OWT61993.1 hypothetical protein CEY11_09290 [Candidimonas nitroreducens]